MLLFRNAKTGEIVVGAENKVEQCTYVAAITRIPEELDDELTGGWKVIEVGVSHLNKVSANELLRWPAGALVHIFKSTTQYLYLSHYCLDHDILHTNICFRNPIFTTQF